MRSTILLLIFGCGWVSTTYAIIFDRRDRPPAEFSYFLYPIAGSIPGVQDFYGLGLTAASIGGSEMDVTAVRLNGPTEYFDGDFQIDIVTVLDIPLFTERLTFSYFYTSISNGGWPEGERGINSDPDSKYVLLATGVYAGGGELSLNLMDNQFEIYYGTVDANVTPYGVVDPNGTFYNAEETDLAKTPTAYRYGLYWDDTDDRRDPRLGYRVQYEKTGVPSSRGEVSAFFQEDYNLTAFIPVLSDLKGVLVLNQFFSAATVTERGTVKKDRYTCGAGAPAGCQAMLDQLYERQLAEANNGKATSLGGTQRLRGYRTNRFFDTYTNFRGVEFRWYIAEIKESFNFVVEKGILTGLQLATFYEEGTVSPNRAEIWNNFKQSYGLGFRALFNTIVFRADQGFSNEGSETSVYVGYSF